MRLLVRCVFLIATGCGFQPFRLAPVQVEPIHVTIDVNVHDTPTRHGPPGP